MKNLVEIWPAVVANDRAAWSELVDLLSNLVFSVALQAGLEPAEAEDCAQQTWITLYRNRKRIKNAQGLPAWLIRTTSRQARYLLRRKTRRSELISDYDVVNATTLPDEELVALEWRTILLEAVKKLDPRCRELITGLFIDEEILTYAQLAVKLKVSINTLSPLRIRCLNRLRSILEEMGYNLH